jgi:hypothetical protein
MPDNEYDEAELVAATDHLIASATAFGLDETVFILKMARLDMVARLNGITMQELKTFGAALAKRLEPQAAASRLIRQQYGEARARAKARRIRTTRLRRRS